MTVFEQNLFAGLVVRVVRRHGAGQKPLRTGAHACRLSLVHLSEFNGKRGGQEMRK
jgi:hypothetical protein